MTVNNVDMSRFKLGRMLGEGAELQVFSANDTSTGRPVVIKRPHPSLIERSQHNFVDHKIEESLALRHNLGNDLPYVSKGIGYGIIEPRSDYFGDSLDLCYSVMIEERAVGIPLVGSPIDRIKGAPIGLPQNLFALHPMKVHSKRGGFSIVRDLLTIAEVLYDRGQLLADISPMNVFFAPLTGSITLVDLGSVANQQHHRNRKTHLDLHDFYLEIFKWYVTATPTPYDAALYSQPHGIDSVVMFKQDLEWMKIKYSCETPTYVSSVVISILEKIKRRGYQDLEEFREELNVYLSKVSEWNVDLCVDIRLTQAWQTAFHGLHDPYWTKFLFEPDKDLEFFQNCD